jgi:hypothetical protein
MVVALDDATGVKSTAQTSSDGVYRFNHLAVGRYSLTATATGFTTDTLNTVDLSLNSTIT